MQTLTKASHCVMFGVESSLIDVLNVTTTLISYGDFAFKTESASDLG